MTFAINLSLNFSLDSAEKYVENHDWLIENSRRNNNLRFEKFGRIGNFGSNALILRAYL